VGNIRHAASAGDGTVETSNPSWGLLRVGRHVAILALDGVVAASAVHLAMELRFEGSVPQHYSAALTTAMVLAAGLRVLCNFTVRLHYWAFRNSGLQDALRVVLAGFLGSVAFVALSQFVVPGGLPRTVYALDFFLSTTFFGILRFGPGAVIHWRTRWLRRGAGAVRTLVVGVGSEAGALVRELSRSVRSTYDVVGFVSEDPSIAGYSMDGTKVIGAIRDMPGLIRRYAVKMVLLADPEVPASRIRELLDLCENSRARFKIIPASFTHRNHRISAAALHDLSPEDLLPRPSIAFDGPKIRSLVSGRRILVTGAGGSIGGEICDQLVRYGAQQLVMVDMNENELYLRQRRLEEGASSTEIWTEVADVREPSRLKRLGEQYRPDIVFHAAAHKHVPLMETAPEEAVKNNVFGTINVAQMAHGCGAERFVLISTDKAVNPTSVMGASKRVAEMAIRHIGRSSQTRMAAVRFGNVLGSSGSVVPLFKQQIERGGPVTVTHPDCRRFFMTIPEAVGLVLMAGLDGDGEVFVLDMGEQIRIVDLARNLITLSGHVPGEDISIVFTGLRPGEKLYEELLTEDEEETRAVSERIHVARSPAPPPDLEARLSHLRRLADDGDRSGIFAALSALVPTYRRTLRTAPPRATVPPPTETKLGATHRAPVTQIHEPIAVGALARRA